MFPSALCDCCCSASLALWRTSLSITALTVSGSQGGIKKGGDNIWLLIPEATSNNIPSRSPIIVMMVGIHHAVPIV